MRQHQVDTKETEGIEPRMLLLLLLLFLWRVATMNFEVLTATYCTGVRMSSISLAYITYLKIIILLKFL